LQVLRETTSPILKITPVNEILPKHDTLNARKSFYLEPFARNGIGKSRKNSKLLDVECLIQMAFFKNVRKFDTAKLFVGRHWIKIFAVCSGKKSIPQSLANLKQSKCCHIKKSFHHSTIITYY
jgi:hypothetical protein